MTVRTPLTYYGGKQALARQIVPLLPSHRVYLEPFAGGAAVLFAKPRAERETLNDLDGTIMRFWRALRDQPDELAQAVALTPYGRQEWRESRDETDDDLEAARRLLVNVDQSFSRSRRSWAPPCIGDGRGRWQPGSWANLPAKLLAATDRLAGVALENCDALSLIERFDRDDCVMYLDPPYTGDHRLRAKGAAAGGSHGYDVDTTPTLWADMVEVLRGVTKARVLLSGYPCEEAEGLGWEMVPLTARRTVQSRDGDSLPFAPEVLWLSPNVDAELRLEVA